jgi:hypothetical protein
MDTKEKLLKLINSCIDNKAFYQEDGEEKCTVVSVQKTSFATCQRYVEPYISSQSDSRKQFVAKLEELKIDKHNVYVKIGSGINVKFKDLPGLNAHVYSKVISTKEISEFSIDEFKRVSAKKSWFEKTGNTIEIVSDGKIECKVLEREFTLYAKIVFGHIECDISTEELDSFHERIIENTKKFTIQLDQEKLDERLAQYQLK